MTRKLVLLLLSAALLHQANAQCSTCSATNFTLDLSASIDTVVTIQSTRNGNCCSGSNCIMFYLTINPAVSFVNLTVANPAPTGSAFYQIDCGTQANLGTPICVVGRTTVCISYCKPGNDNAIYTITAAGAILPSQDITVREGCTGEMSITGLIPSTITWTSIFPGSQGAYNSLLSCSSGCLNTTVKPLPGAPAYIDYMVSGSRICGGIHRDTIRVFTTPQPSVSITPANPALCASGGGTLDLTANVANGDQPYNYLWNTGETTSTISVSSFGTYTVAVTDSRGCDPSIQTTVLSSIPNPAAPSISSNSPVCEGSSIQLSAPFIAGAIYQWSGPGGFSSDLQNPVINNASAAHSGSYSLKIINGGCSSPTSFTNVVVNALPAPPLITGNATVCENNTLTLSANAIPGATYQWTGPNNFSSSGLQLTIQNVTVSHGGNYYATATINGCSGAAAMYNVQINTLPSAPAITVNNVCEGSDLMLVASDIIGASYLWSGPNGFNSSDQNPVIQNAATNASGVYNVRATVAGCQVAKDLHY